MYTEKVSGRSRNGRAALEEMLKRGIRKGDSVVVSRLDRLARSTRDLIHISDILEEKGVALKVTEQQIDTTTPAGKLFFHLVASFAEFEASIREERQREGIDAAKAKGKDSPFKGRPATIDSEAVRAAHAAGEGASSISRRMGISRSSVYRLLEAVNEPLPVPPRAV